MILLTLPDSLVIAILSEWIHMEDVYHLDMSCSEYKSRECFVSVLQSLRCVNMSRLGSSASFEDSPLEEEHIFMSKASNCGFNYLNWLSNRQRVNISVKIWLSFDDYDDVTLLASYCSLQKVFPFVDSVCLHFAGDSNEISTRISGYFNKALKVFSSAVMRVCTYGGKPTFARKLLAMQDVLLTDRIRWIDLTLLPDTLQDRALLTEFLSVLGLKIRSLGDVFLSRFQGDVSLLPLVSQHCSQLTELPYNLSMSQFSLFWPYIRGIKLSRLHLEMVESEPPILPISMLEIATALPLLQDIELEGSRYLEHDMHIVVSIFQHCRSLLCLRVSDWFGWTIHPSAKSGAVSSYKVIQREPTLFLCYSPNDLVGGQENASVAQVFSEFLGRLQEVIPCLHFFSFCSIPYPPQSRIQDYMDCLLTAIMFVKTAPCCLSTRKLEIDVIPEFFNDCVLPQITDISLMSDEGFQLDDCTLHNDAGRAIAHAFPNAKSLRIFLPRGNIESLSNLLLNVPGITDLTIKNIIGLHGFDIVPLLLGTNRVWDRVKLSYSYPVGTSAGDIKVMLDRRFDLNSLFAKEINLKVRQLVFNGVLCSAIDVVIHQRKLGYGKLPISF